MVKEVPQAGRNRIPGEPVVLGKLPLLFEVVSLSKKDGMGQDWTTSQVPRDSVV